MSTSRLGQEQVWNASQAQRARSELVRQTGNCEVVYEIQRQSVRDGEYVEGVATVITSSLVVWCRSARRVFRPARAAGPCCVVVENGGGRGRYVAVTAARSVCGNGGSSVRRKLGVKLFKRRAYHGKKTCPHHHSPDSERRHRHAGSTGRTRTGWWLRTGTRCRSEARMVAEGWQALRTGQVVGEESGENVVARRLSIELRFASVRTILKRRAQW